VVKLPGAIDPVLPEDADDAGVTDDEVLEVVAVCPESLAPCAEGLGAAIDDSDDVSQLADDSISDADSSDEAALVPAASAASATASSSILGRDESHHSLRIMKRRAARELELQQKTASAEAVEEAATALSNAKVPVTADAPTASTTKPLAARERGRPPKQAEGKFASAGAADAAPGSSGDALKKHRAIAAPASAEAEQAALAAPALAEGFGGESEPHSSSESGVERGTS
jgi:hypothetical protein